jgi:hypothetical protein
VVAEPKPVVESPSKPADALKNVKSRDILDILDNYSSDNFENESSSDGEPEASRDVSGSFTKDLEAVLKDDTKMDPR